MSDPTEEPTPPENVPGDLIEGIRRLDDVRLSRLVEYCQALLEYSTQPISEILRETEDPDLLVDVEDHDNFAVVTRRDPDDGTPLLYHVTREHHPDGDVELKWRLIGPTVE